VSKKIIIIAGPNGAGKTTFARAFLHCRVMQKIWSAGVLARNKAISIRRQKPGEDARVPLARA
jgi:ABC-type Mn2+/Zn2+ transport system ATPase subunit